MSMMIRNNIAALHTYNMMNSNHAQMQKSLTHVATDMKINSAQDDSAAYAVSEKMRLRIRSLEQAHINTQNGSSMIRTAEGDVSSILDALRTLKAKAIDAANDSNTDEDRRIMQKEFNQLVDQIDDNALTTFNRMYLVDGTRNNALLNTETVLFNQKLARDTNTGTKFYELKNRAGESLGINENDRIAWSYVSGIGGTFHGEISASSNFIDLEGNEIPLSNAMEGSVGDVVGHFNIFFTDTHIRPNSYVDKSGQRIGGLDGIILTPQTTLDEKYNIPISAFTLKVMDSRGNVNKYATAQLQFDEIQRPEKESGDKALSFQVGADANVATKFALTDMRAQALGLKYAYDGRDYSWGEGMPDFSREPSTISISTKEDANAAIQVLDTAIKRVLDQQTTIGAALSRLEHTATNLTTTITNDQASESVIRDADMTKEMTGYLKNNLLAQSSQAMFAQANQAPLDVMALINGDTSS